MKTISIAALALAILALGFVESAANAQVSRDQVSRDQVRRVEVRRIPVYVPRGSCGPPDYTIVPRYCYDPRDDRVDTSPYAKPVAPVHGLDYGGPSGGW